MIVPRTRLLFWVAVIAVPMSVLAVPPAETGLGIEGLPQAMDRFAQQGHLLAIGLIGGLVLLAVFDAALAFGSLNGVRAELPEVARLTKDREGTLPVHLFAAPGKRRLLRLGLAFPPEITTPSETIETEIAGTTAAASVTWPCTATRRGRYILDRVYLEGSSPLGFWAVRSSVPTQSEVRVYPNLMHERRNVAALFLNRGVFGIHQQRQVGQGREFEKLREYVPGDSYDDVHWKATARRGHPITKTYQIERTQEVYVLIDTSRLSARKMSGGIGLPETTQLERFLTSAMVLGLAAERQGDLYGLMTFDDRVGTFIRAKNGKAHYGVCRDALYTLNASRVNPDFDEVFSFLRLRLRRRALVIFLTNLDDPVLAESFVKNVHLIGRHHLMLVGMPIPSGVKPLFQDDKADTVSDVYDRLAGHMRWQGLRELERVLQRQGVQFLLLDHARMAAQLVTQYMNIKQRQLL
ncbi:MAG: hypothetical protein AMXMBFR84_48730 [Candidatus Hydrogenedentota bacterium]